MIRRIHLGIIAVTLALVGSRSASAQGFVPLGLRSIAPYTGLLFPYANQQASIPTTFIDPYPVIYLPVPQPVYVPVPVSPQQPAVEPVRVAVVNLRAGSAPVDMRVKRDTVVTWVNAGDRQRTLFIEAAAPAGSGTGASFQSGVLRPNTSFSLAFHQPGVYTYYLQDQPDHRARVIVEE